MLSTWIQSKKDEEGFTLIELLVVVIIIGILAAIAIPVFLSQRENGWRSAGSSDLRNAAIMVETVLTQEGQLPTALTVEEDTAELMIGTEGTGIFVTASENMEVVYTPNMTDQTYIITGNHGLLNQSLIYNSTSGGLANAEWN